MNHAGIQVMASLLTGVGVVPAILLRKHPLPAPLHRCMGKLPPQGVGMDEAFTNTAFAATRSSTLRVEAPET